MANNKATVQANNLGDGSKKHRRHFITYRVDSLSSTLRDKFLAARSRRSTKESCGEGCMRFLNFTRFCLGCSASLFQVLAPWVLSTIELVSVLLIYFLGTSKSLIIHEPTSNYHFYWRCSLEDILGLAIARSLILSVTYAWGVHSVQSAGGAAHRTYLYTSYLLAAACFPYIIVKTILYHYGPDAIPAAAIFIITGLFCWIHVFAARHTVAWARRRFQMGLAGFNLLWEEHGDEAYTILRRPDVEEMAKCSDRGGGFGASGSGGGGGFLGDWSGDVPAESLADGDSKFADVFGIRVHYKEVWPSGMLNSGGGGGGRSSGSPGASRSSSSSDGGGSAGSGSGGNDLSGTGIVLVHGFGGGVFAWRHVMEALALQCQCRVVAFDRPAFGLTSRPLITNEQRHSCANPYSMGAQAELMMQLCSQLGLRRVLLLAHADACLLALHAASIAAAEPQGSGSSTLAGASDGEGEGERDSSSSAAGRDAASAAQDASATACVATSPPPHTAITVQPEATSTAEGSGKAANSTGPFPPESTWPGGGGGFGNILRRRAASSAAFPDALLSTEPSLTEALGGVVEDPSASPGGGRPSSSAHLGPAAATVTADPFCSDAAVAAAGPDVAFPSSSGSGDSNASSSGGTSSAGTSGPHRSGFEGPEARAAASYALGHFPSESTEGGPSPEGAARFGHAADDDSEARPLMSSAASTGPHWGGGAGGGPPKLPPGAASAVSSQWPRHRRCLSMPPPGCAMLHPRAEAGGLPGGGSPQVGPWPSLLGLVLLHPNLVGQMGPTLSRLLSRSTLFGSAILRPLLRSEVGEVSNRRAWHHAERLTPEVLELYKAPLRVEGWDTALMETARLGKEHTQGDLEAHLAAARQLPTLVVTATHDYIATPAKVEQLCTTSLPEAQSAVLSDCGHLSHEEAPGLLLQELMPFCGQVLLPHQA